MAHKHQYDMSELEREFELEMDTQEDYGTDHELEATEVYDDAYEEGEFEYEYDENDNDFENEYEFEDFPMSYGERLFEIAQREFESEFEMDEALHQVMDDMEREYFFKKLGGLFKKGVRFVSKNPVLKGLIGKGLKAAAGFVPGGTTALSAIKSFGGPLLKGIQNNWQGALKAGVSALAPDAAGMANRFARRFGISANFPEQQNQEAFERLAQGIQRSYEFAAQHFGDHVGDPLVANRLANRAFEVGVKSAMMTKPNNGQTPPFKAYKGVRTVRLQERPGEEIQKIVIVIDRKA
ncbi:MAG TPA: hypothetical protein PKA00_09995 [Saprospiraceae bacterium]|nr:hypothetical protein [Saprospiraceae bacterium]HMQ83229.1 hypothetical protein [Saprospiraceae bacterium]